MKVLTENRGLHKQERRCCCILLKDLECAAKFFASAAIAVLTLT